MSTVDLTKVAGFKAVDAEGNDLGVVSLSEMTNMVKESIIQEAVAMQSVSTLAEASTLAATDTYEDKLDISDTFSYVRTLDSSGNPKRTSQNALATVVGGLIGIADKDKNGLLSKNIYASKFRSISAGNSKIVSFYVPRYTRGVINVLAVSTQNIIFYKEFKFIVDMNTGKPSLYGDSGDIRYKIESQGAMIYMKLSDYSTVNYYFQYAEILGDAHIVDAAVLDNFPPDAVSL